MSIQLLSVEELSRQLCIKRDTIYLWVSQRKIPYRKIGRLVRFDPREIEEWLRSCRVEATNIDK